MLRVFRNRAGSFVAVGCLLVVLSVPIGIVLGASMADDLRISQGIVLNDEGTNPSAMAPATSDIFVIAGQSGFDESALGFRLSQDAPRAELLWRYTKERPLADPVHGLRFATAADMPDFRGVAATSDGSVFLCGYGPGSGPGKSRPSLLTHLESSGRVISENVVLPPKVVDSSQGHPSDPNILGEAVLTGFDDCVTWGDKVGIIGHVSHFFPSQNNPKIREGRYYHWILVVNTTGEVVWQKLIPLASGLSVISDLTSVLITPQHNLIFTLHYAGQSEILSVSQAGEVRADEQLKGFYVAVHPMDVATTIQLFGGDPKGAKSLITLDEDLGEVHREDGLNIPEFVASKAYALADTSLLLVGEEVREVGSVPAVRFVSASRQIIKKSLTHGSLFDAGSARVSVLTGRPGELLIARTLLEKGTRGVSKRLGLALDVIETSKK